MQATSTISFDPNHARVLVVGPMAGGKTTLVQSLCHGATGGTASAGVQSKPPPTIGCNVDVKVLLHSMRYMLCSRMAETLKHSKLSDAIELTRVTPKATVGAS